MRGGRERRMLWVSAAAVLSLVTTGVWHSRAATDGGPDTLDAYTRSVTSPDFIGIESRRVPMTEIRSRCGDGDGCDIRLWISEETGSALAGRMQGKFFSTTATGTSWRAFEHDSIFFNSGTTTDGTTATILVARHGILGDRDCFFRDDGSSNDYRIVADVLKDSPADCTIRIDD